MEKLQAAMDKARLARRQSMSEQNAQPDPQVPEAGHMPPAQLRPVAGPKDDASQSTKEDAGRGVAPPQILQPAPNSRDHAWQALPALSISKHHLEKQRVVTGEAGSQAAPFDILRTKTLLQMRQNGWKRIAITSPMPSAGKTTTACNLALGLGRQRDLRSILFDFDLRDPSVDKFFNASPTRGIGDVLAGRADFAENALRYGSNVAIAMTHEPERDPTRLLLSDDTTSLLAEVEARYDPDVMIFDLPSVLVNDDTRAFLKNVDCALIVIRANKTRYHQFDTCEREVAEHTNVLGVVLNANRQS